MTTLTHHRTDEPGGADARSGRRRTLKHAAFGVVVFLASGLGLMAALGHLTYALLAQECTIDSPSPFAPLAEFSCEMDNLQYAFVGMILGFVLAIGVTVLAVRWIRRRDAARAAA